MIYYFIIIYNKVYIATTRVLEIIILFKFVYYLRRRSDRVKLNKILYSIVNVILG